MLHESAAVPEGLQLYISLVWLFVFVITFLMLFLCYLYISMRRALERESKSLAFSDMVIAGLETERGRISRELHDAVLPLVRDREVSGIIRAICRELAPPDFTRLSLAASLADLCGKFSGRSGIECACSIDEKLNFNAVSVENQLHLYRMVQEALTNIEKHSKAHKASLTARRNFSGSCESIVICVSDDGEGIRSIPGMRSILGLQNISGTGLGIRSMQQRAAIIGAKLDFISENTNGLMVRIEIFPKVKPLGS